MIWVYNIRRKNGKYIINYSRLVYGRNDSAGTQKGNG